MPGVLGHKEHHVKRAHLRSSRGVDLDGTPHLWWNLRVAGRQLARGHDAVEQRGNQLKINSHVNPKLTSTRNDLLAGEGLLPVVQDAGQARLVGVNPIEERETLCTGGNRERVRKAMLLASQLNSEVLLEPHDELALLGAVVRLGVTHDVLEARHATTSDVCPYRLVDMP